MISIIIVGYNSQKDLGDCLSSIFSSTYKDFRIILVDNNSYDGSIPFVQKNYKDTVIIENPKNMGFAGGNNIGIRKALELKSDYIFLLNPDTIIDSNCMTKMVQESSHNKIIQPLILLHENGKKTNSINTTGNSLNFLGFSYCNDYRKINKEQKKREIGLASGAAALIPASAFEKTGLFDEFFFMYHEDVDLFWRMRAHGYNIEIVPDAKVWHKYSFSRNKQKMFFAERNRIIFLLKNFSIFYWLLILPCFVLNEFLVILYSIVGGWFKLKILSYYGMFKWLSIKKMHQTKKNKRPLNELKKFIGYKISFSEVTNWFFYPYEVFLFLYYRIIYLFIY